MSCIFSEASPPAGGSWTVVLRDYLRVPDARTGIGDWFRYYNHERHHQGLGYHTPATVYRQGAVR